MIRLKEFMGLLPIRHRDALPPGFANRAENCELASGAIRPKPNLRDIGQVGETARMIFWANGAWRWMGNVLSKVVPGPVAADRYYTTEPGTFPVVRSFVGNGFMRRLALDRPTTPMTLQTSPAPPVGGEAEIVHFCYTWVTDLGEQSQPSPLSARIEFYPGGTLNLGFTVDGLPGGGARGITKKRIYRTFSDISGIATLNFVKEIDANASTFQYSLADDPAQEVLPSGDYDPPHDRLGGLTPMPNGIMAGFVDRTIMFCEPYQPHAWPIKYRLLTDSPIVGLAAFGNSLAILTTGAPYIVSGSHPSTMSMVKWEDNLPCISAGSIVDRGYAALYASNYGLVEINEGGARLVTQGLFDQRTWGSISPRQIISAAFVEGRYHFLTATLPTTVNNYGIIDLTGQRPDFLRGFEAARYITAAPQHGQMVILGEALGATGTRAVQLRDGPGAPALPFTWESGILTEGFLNNYGWGMVRTDSPPTEDHYVNVYLIDAKTGQQIARMERQLNQPVRLPSGRLDQEFIIRIQGNLPVREVAFGNSSEELVDNG